VCLARGTLVAAADGRDLPIEQLHAGMELLDQRGAPVRIMSVRTGFHSPLMYRLHYAHGSHTVTPDHLVTLRWNSSDIGSSPMCPSLQLHQGDLFEISAKQLFHLQSNDAEFMTRVSIPMVCTGRPLVPSSASCAAEPIPAHFSAQLQTAWPLCEQNRMVCASSPNPSSPLHYPTAAPTDRAECVYMLHDPRGPIPRVKAKPYAVLQLERAWAQLDLNPAQLHIMIAAVADDDSSSPACLESMAAALATKPGTIVAFGDSIRACWTNEARTLSGVQSARVIATDREGKMERMELRMEDGSSIRVFGSPHPCDGNLSHRLLAALAAAHDPSSPRSPSDLEVLAREFNASALQGIERVPGGEYVSVEVCGVEKRFVLSDGACTHNCSERREFEAAMQHYQMAVARNPNYVEVRMRAEPPARCAFVSSQAYGL